MKRIILFAACFICVLFTKAQTIKGKIVDAATKSPLSGATVMMGGKDIASSDKDGMFSFKCTSSVTISVSFVGYETQKRTANCNDELNIELAVAGNTLDNVEITATSNQNKSLLYQPSSITKLSTTNRKPGRYPRSKNN